MTLVSIIVPVYNTGEYLGACIRSILSQTYRDFELILVNDGSTDASLQICRQYAAEDVRINVIDKTNEGVSEARNVGLGQAKGQFICFIDSDDVVGPEYLKALIDNQLMYGSQLSVSGLTLHFRGEEREFQVKECSFRKDEFLKLFSSTDFLFLLRGPCCKLFRRDIINKYQLSFNKSVHFGEDAIFVLQYCLYIEQLSFTDNVSYQYYRREGGLVCKKPHRRDAIAELQAFNDIFDVWANRIGKDPLEIPYFKETLEMIYRRLLGGSTEGFTFRQYIEAYSHIDARIYKQLFTLSGMKGELYLALLNYAPRLLGAYEYFRIGRRR